MNIEFAQLREEHAEEVIRWRTHPDVTRYMYTDPHPTLEEQRSWITRVNQDPSKLYWMVKVEGINSGVVNLMDIDKRNRHTCWAYYLDPARKGQGIGSQVEINILEHVFSTMEFNRLWCEVLAFNEAVVRIHEKFGSRVEGTLRQHVYKNGVFHDVVRMGILKPEWMNIREQIMEKYQFRPAIFEV